MGWVTLHAIGVGRGAGGLVPGTSPVGRRGDGTAIGDHPGRGGHCRQTGAAQGATLSVMARPADEPGHPGPLPDA